MFRKQSKERKEILRTIVIFSRIVASETQELISFSQKEINQDIDKFPNYGDSEDRATKKKSKNYCNLILFFNARHFNYKSFTKI